MVQVGQATGRIQSEIESRRTLEVAKFKLTSRETPDY